MREIQKMLVRGIEVLYVRWRFLPIWRRFFKGSIEVGKAKLISLIYDKDNQWKVPERDSSDQDHEWPVDGWESGIQFKVIKS